MNIDEFLKVELKTAKILEASRVEGSEKLVKLMLDAGDVNESGTQVSRQILAGIGKQYEPAELVGRTIVIVANLEPRQMMGETSNGMLLAAADAEGKPRLAMIDGEVAPGTRLS